MAEQMGLMEFFAMEASDYLERLDAVVSQGAEPDRDEFVRLTRALRGSALMANQQAFAGAAGGATSETGWPARRRWRVTLWQAPPPPQEPLTHYCHQGAQTTQSG